MLTLKKGEERSGFWRKRNFNNTSDIIKSYKLQS